MQNIIKDYECLYDLIRKFYEAFRRQWFWENKPQGFEVHDARLGGLLMRVEHCRKRLEDYINGSVDRIEELEESELDFWGRGFISEEEKKSFGYNGWYATVTAGVI